MSELFLKLADLVNVVPQLAWQSTAVVCLLVFWFAALKPLLAKKKLPIWRQILGGLALGVAFPAIFQATVISLGPMG